MRTLRLVILIPFTITTLCSQAQSLNFDWVKTMPVMSTYGNLRTITADADNNGGITSIFSLNGTVDINPQSDTTLITAISTYDLLIQKIDTLGNLKWAKQISSPPGPSVTGQSVKHDGSGNVYVLGTFSNSVDFNPGTGIFILNSLGGSKDVFILKLDSLGSFIWAKSFGSPSVDRGLALDIDNFDNVYISGIFQDSINFNPGVNNQTRIAKGFQDSFILKLDSAGNFKWANTYGSSLSTYCNDIVIDNQSNLILTGIYRGRTSFNPNDTTLVLTGNQYRNLFVLKLDSAGDFIWVKGTPPSDNITGNKITLDPTGNIYISGVFDQHANFDTAASSSLYTSEQISFDVYDAYLMKLRSNGDFVWVKGFQGYGANSAYSPIFTPNHDMIIAGNFTYELDLDPDTTNYIFTGGWQTHSYIEKLDSLGNFIWAYPFISSISCFANPITLTPNNELYLGGTFNGRVDFDPSTDSATHTSQNGNHSFYLKLKPCFNPSPISTVNVTACNSYTWTNGTTYTQSTNQPSHIFSNVLGCDSVVKLNLTILHSGVSYDTVTTCDSITWIDGNTYSQSNDSAAIITLPNASSNGCDSLVILKLINQSNTSTTSKYGCNSYTWVNGVTYYSNTDTATMVYTNINGCDSVVTLDLKLKSYDTSIVTNGLLITAAFTQGLRYQWYNCDTDSIIPDATYRTFLADSIGNYAVIFSRPNWCMDTSSCFWVAPVGMEDDNNLYKDIDFYPNPTKDFITLEFPDYIKGDIEILVANLSGQIIHQQKVSKQTTPWIAQIDLSTFNSGLYILKVIVDENEYNFKLSKY
jgi:hypothetical protein